MMESLRQIRALIFSLLFSKIFQEWSLSEHFWAAVSETVRSSHWKRYMKKGVLKDFTI